MLQEFFETFLVVGGVVVLYHLLGRWSSWFKVRTIPRLLTAIFVWIFVLSVISVAIE